MHNHLTKLNAQLNDTSERAEATAASLYRDVPLLDDHAGLTRHAHQVMALSRELSESAQNAARIAGEMLCLASISRNGGI